MQIGIGIGLSFPNGARRRPPPPNTLIAGRGVFFLVGEEAAPSYSLILAASPGTFALSGEAVTMTADGGAGGAGGVAFDAVSSSSVANNPGTTLSWTHAPVSVPTAVAVTVQSWPDGPTGVTYGGVAMAQEVANVANANIYIFGLANPPAGNQTVAVTSSTTGRYVQAGAVTVTGSDTTTTFDATNVATGGGTSASVSVASASDELIVDIIGNQAFDAVQTPGGSQTLRWGPLTVGGDIASTSTAPAGGPSTSMSWTTGGSAWAIAAASFKKSSGNPVLQAGLGTFTLTGEPLQTFIPVLAASAGTFSLSGQAATLSNSGATSPFIVNLVYESTALAAPQSFRDAMQAAANILMAAIQDPVTVNLSVGYGTSAFFGETFTDGRAESFDIQTGISTFSAARNAFVAHATSTGQADTIAVANSLPPSPATSVPGDGKNSGSFTRSVAKVLGLSGVTARDTTIDGRTLMGSGIDPGSIVGVALHELTHAMGRAPDSLSFWFSRFTGPNAWYTSATPHATYLSLDAGSTVLVTLSATGDTSDFADAGDDVFNASYNPGAPYTQNLSLLDKKVLRMLGYKVI